MSETPLISRSPSTARATHVTVDVPTPGARPIAFGSQEFVVIGGPCSVEGRDMLLNTAAAVRRSGGRLLRGGAFKPRTSPYAFQGLGEPALEMLTQARRETGLPIVTEVLDVRHVEMMGRHADMLQIGARNMQHVPLLDAVGELGKPVLLKRGLSATVKELLAAAEYIARKGNLNIVLCERGIRTFESATRNTLDIAAVPVLKQETHLPVLVDPSHAAGRARYVRPLARAALAAGADGLLVEVHPDPATAKSDGDQSLDFGEFDAMMRELATIAPAVGRHVGSEEGDEGDAGSPRVHIPGHVRQRRHGVLSGLARLARMAGLPLSA